MKLLVFVMPWGGMKSKKRDFSVRCSTPELPGPVANPHQMTRIRAKASFVKDAPGPVQRSQRAGGLAAPNLS